MKKVICITPKTSSDKKHTTVKDQIYTVYRDNINHLGMPMYELEEIPEYWIVQSAFRDIESPPALVTFTKIVEEYPIHAN